MKIVFTMVGTKLVCLIAIATTPVKPIEPDGTRTIEC